MSIQLRDNTFTKPEKLTDELLQKFKTLADIGEAKALHVGTLLEIEKAKNNVDINSRIDAIEREVKNIKPISSSCIYLPNTKEIKRYSEDNLWA